MNIHMSYVCMNTSTHIVCVYVCVHVCVHVCVSVCVWLCLKGVHTAVTWHSCLYWGISQLIGRLVMIHFWCMCIIVSTFDHKGWITNWIWYLNAHPSRSNGVCIQYTHNLWVKDSSTTFTLYLHCTCPCILKHVALNHLCTVCGDLILWFQINSCCTWYMGSHVHRTSIVKWLASSPGFPSRTSNYCE